MSTWQIGQKPAIGTLNLRSGDHRSFQAIRDARQQFIRDFFQGTKLKWSVEGLAKTSHAIRGNTKKLGSETRGAAKAVGGAVASEALKNAEQLLCELFNVPCFDAVKELVAELGVTLINEVAGAIVPLVSTGSYTGQALYQWGKTSVSIWDRIKVARHSSHVLPGDPAAAVAALTELIERDLARNALVATRMSARAGVAALCDTGTILGIAGAAPSFGGSAVLTGIAQVAGPMAGAMNVAAALCHQLFLLARDLKEKKAANELLADASTIDAGIFDVCPILGCYLLVNGDVSTIIDFDPADMVHPNWMDVVAKKYGAHIQPLLSLARSAIRNHRFALAGAGGELIANKGLVGRKWWHRFVPGK